MRVVRQCGFRAFKRERKRKAESGSGTGEIAGIARLGWIFVRESEFVGCG